MSETFFTSDRRPVFSRILNRDAVGLVRERLAQTTIVDALAWFNSPRGCDQGAALLRIAPLLDTVVDRFARVPNAEGEVDLRWAAYVNFGVGLTLGAEILAHREGDNPFGPELTLQESLGVLATPCLLEQIIPVPDGSPLPNIITLHAVGLDPGLDVAIEAGTRIALLRVDAEHRLAALRFLLVLGLCGAGVLPRSPRTARPTRGTRRERPAPTTEKGLFE